ncbi:MAG: hypothetical protein FWE85_02060, partial [Clostridiales bacterium]|nr:hypothetical protein [Clostridiales bacterium]
MSAEMKKALRVAGAAVFFAAVFFLVWQYAGARSLPAKIAALAGVAEVEIAAEAVCVTPAAGCDWPRTCSELYKIIAAQKKPLVINNGGVDAEPFAQAARKIRLAMAEAKA